MNKSSTGRFFEDFTLDEVIRHGTPRTITAGDVSLYIALTGSRFVLHSAAPVAEAIGFEDTPVDDMLVFHIAFGKTVPDISLNAVANLGYAEVRFLAPVFVGDTLFVSSRVIGLKENSNGTTGIVYVRSSAYNQHGDKVLSWVRWVMVAKREASQPMEPAVVPTLSTMVSAEHLNVAPHTDFRRLGASLTGSDLTWQDYQVGEWIDHVDGVTVDEAEHVMATRLYQNTAQVHFNEHRMQNSRFGRRLVYGGHVMSLARALSHNGLANAVQILAMNGGSHMAPTFAGDTLYAASRVLDKWPIHGRDDCAALRLETVVRKNSPVHRNEHGAPLNSDTAPLVLTWDYTVLVPTRLDSMPIVSAWE